MRVSGRWRLVLAGLLVLGPSCLLLWWAASDLHRRAASEQAESQRQLQAVALLAARQRMNDLLSAALNAAQAVAKTTTGTERLAALRHPALVILNGVQVSVAAPDPAGPQLSSHPLLIAARRLEFSQADTETVLAAYARVVAESADSVAVEEARSAQVAIALRLGRAEQAQESFRTWMEAGTPRQTGPVVSLALTLGGPALARIWEPVVLGLWPCRLSERLAVQVAARRQWLDGEHHQEILAADRLLWGARLEGALAQEFRDAKPDDRSVRWLAGQPVAMQGSVVAFVDAAALTKAITDLWSGLPAGTSQELILDPPWGQPLAIRMPLPAIDGAGVWRQIAVLGAALLAILAGLISLLWFYLRSERLARLKTAFVADVSHELKTPLALMRLHAEMLDHGYFEAEERSRALRVIIAETDRLGHLVENILDVARLERGQRAFRFAFFDLAEVVRRTAEAWRPEVERRQGTLRLEIDTLPPLFGDAEALAQVLVNLLSNAIKFSPQVCEIQLDLRRDGDGVLIRVADRGIGIPPVDRARLFTPFHRAENARMLAIRGTGLGLALVGRIVAAHGGSARLLERDGGGSIAEVRLPGKGSEHGS